MTRRFKAEQLRRQCKIVCFLFCKQFVWQVDLNQPSNRAIWFLCMFFFSNLVIFLEISVRSFVHCLLIEAFSWVMSVLSCHLFCQWNKIFQSIFYDTKKRSKQSNRWSYIYIYRYLFRCCAFSYFICHYHLIRFKYNTD